MSTAIVLNGTSSSGKTTLARAFQEIAAGRFLNFSIDHILSALPPGEIARIGGGGELAGLRLPELHRAYYACARQLLELGHDLLLDNAIVSRHQAELLVAATESHRVLLVGLECPAEILRERERSRGDRRPGMAEQQQARIHSWLEYDLVVDTSATSAERAAAQIAEALAAGTNGAMERTRERLTA